MQVRSSFDEDKIRRTDERKTVKVREIGIIGIRVDLQGQYLLFASLKYGRVKLSVMCVLLCLQLWATTASSLLQVTLKLHVHLLVLLLRIAGLAQVNFDDCTRGHLIPRLLSTPGVHKPVCDSSHRVPRYRSSTDVSCLGYVYGSVYHR